MKKYKHLFFDLDRTLYDFETNSTETLSEIFEKYILSKYFLSFEEFHTIYRKNNDLLWNRYRLHLITKQDISWQRFQLTLAAKNLFDDEMAVAMGNDYINHSPDKSRLFPCTHEVLNYLHPKYKLFLITNGFKEVQYKKIDNCHLRQYFEQVFTSEEIGYNKPEKEYFEIVLQKTGASTTDSVVIGDDLEVDIKGANTVGIDTVWFNTVNKTASRPVTFEIDSLCKLKDIF